MAFCTNCGAQIDDGAQFCPACGAKQDRYNAQGGSFSEQFNNLNNTPDHSSEYDPADIAANKGISILAYLGVLVVIPLIAVPNSRYAKFHANQGLLLLIAEAIAGAATGAVTWIPFVGGLVGLALGVFVLVLFIIGLVNAVNGRAKELPIIGKIRLFSC